jgi:hypothetical protein
VDTSLCVKASQPCSYRFVREPNFIALKRKLVTHIILDSLQDGSSVRTDPKPFALRPELTPETGL